MFSLAIVNLSACSAAISSRTGATILHGPHHVAQKSTSTGLSLDNTSVEKDASETSFVAPAFSASLIVVLQSNRYCPHFQLLSSARRHPTHPGRPASARRQWLPHSRCRPR